MAAGVHELKKTPDNPQRIVQEKGKGINSIIRIAYEEEKTPQKIYVDGFSGQIMNVLISLDFDEVLARAERDAIVSR